MKNDYLLSRKVNYALIGLHDSRDSISCDSSNIILWTYHSVNGNSIWWGTFTIEHSRFNDSSANAIGWICNILIATQ